MQNSGISSTEANNRPPVGQPRSRFALTGRSARIDPRIDAARRDLADVRLADRVFAPHYAAPLTKTIVGDTALLSSRADDAETLSILRDGDVFEVLELSSGTAWGVAPATGLVGYIVESALAA